MTNEKWRVVILASTHLLKAQCSVIQENVSSFTPFVLLHLMMSDPWKPFSAPSFLFPFMCFRLAQTWQEKVGQWRGKRGWNRAHHILSLLSSCRAVNEMGECFDEGTFPGCSSYQFGTMRPGAQAVGAEWEGVCMCVCTCRGIWSLVREDRDPEKGRMRWRR